LICCLPATLAGNKRSSDAVLSTLARPGQQVARRPRGRRQTAGPPEQIEFASLCLLKKRYAAAARFYRDAFTAQPGLAANAPSGRRYKAARCAAWPVAARATRDAVCTKRSASAGAGKRWTGSATT